MCQCARPESPLPQPRDQQRVQTDRLNDQERGGSRIQALQPSVPLPPRLLSSRRDVSSHQNGMNANYPYTIYLSKPDCFYNTTDKKYITNASTLSIILKS